MKEEWLSNEELYRAHDTWIEGSDEEKAYKAELERRLKLSGFFDMPLEFYLRELGPEWTVYVSQGVFRCQSIRWTTVGNTVLEAVKLAYNWKWRKEYEVARMKHELEYELEKLMTSPHPFKLKTPNQ